VVADVTTTARVSTATATIATVVSVVAAVVVTVVEVTVTTGLLVAPRLRGAVATAPSLLVAPLLLPVTTTTVLAAPTTRSRRPNDVAMHHGNTNKTGVL
jgi:hypothetical protein